MRFKDFTTYTEDVLERAKHSSKLWLSDAFELEMCRLSTDSMTLKRDLNQQYDTFKDEDIIGGNPYISRHLYRGLRLRYPNLSLPDFIEFRLTWFLFYLLIAWFMIWAYMEHSSQFVIIAYSILYLAVVIMNALFIDFRSPIGFMPVYDFVKLHCTGVPDIDTFRTKTYKEQAVTLAECEYQSYLHKNEKPEADVVVS